MKTLWLKRTSDQEKIQGLIMQPRKKKKNIFKGTKSNISTNVRLSKDVGWIVLMYLDPSEGTHAHVLQRSSRKDSTQK